jgi:hypothetical protein
VQSARTGSGRSYDPTLPKQFKMLKLVAVSHMNQLSRNMADAQSCIALRWVGLGMDLGGLGVDLALAWVDLVLVWNWLGLI